MHTSCGVGAHDVEQSWSMVLEDIALVHRQHEARFVDESEASKVVDAVEVDVNERPQRSGIVRKVIFVEPERISQRTNTDQDCGSPLQIVLSLGSW